MAVQTRIQIRRGTSAQWVASAQTLGNGILYQGEIGYESDTGRFKIGDGSTAWSSLSYASILPSSFVAGSGISLTPGTNGSTLTISLSDPTIQVGDITDFESAVSGLLFDQTLNTTDNVLFNNVKLPNPLTEGDLYTYAELSKTELIIGQDIGSSSEIAAHLTKDGLRLRNVDALPADSDDITYGFTGITFPDTTVQTTAWTGAITSSQVSDFNSSVNDLIDNAVSTSIVAGSGVDIVYNSGNNTLTVSSSLTAGSGIAVSHSSGNYTISLSDPTIQLVDITDLTSNARNFLLTPSSSNLRTLVSDETGTGSLVFGTNPTISSGILAGTSSMNVFNTTATTVNAFGDASTALNIGGGGGNGSVVNIAVGSTPAVGTRNINIATGSWMGGETNINIGIASGGTTTVRNNLVANGNLTVGGSGLVASNINNFDTAVRTSRLDQMSAPTSDVSLNSRKITNLADPTNDQDAATKAYVDAARSGLDVKQSVRVATTQYLGASVPGVIPMIGAVNALDGISVVVGDRILVKNQNTASENGIYVVTNVNAPNLQITLARATDADSSAEVTAGMFTFVTEGTVNADSGWVLTTNDTITLGTTALVFAQFSGAGQITAGAGMTKSGNTLDVGTASSSRIVVNADSIDLATVSQSNSSGSAGVNFAQSVSVDSYGRVTGVTTADVRDATTSVKGISSFSSSSFDVTSGAVSIKTGGVSNSQLANSSVTVGSTSISLGGTSTTLAGLSSVTSTSFVGALTGNASTATALQTARTINGTSFDGTANITIQFVDGGTP